MTEKEFKSCFFQWRIPKTLRYLVMKEMEKMGLLIISKNRRQRIIQMNNYSFNEIKTKNKDYKDGDTKIKSPYLSINDL